MTIDPSSGLPPDVMTGFLMPEDGTGRGQGFISYIARPGTPTGTEIRNIGQIQFDLARSSPPIKSIRTIPLRAPIPARKPV